MHYLHVAVHEVAFHVDSGEWADGAEVFTCTAAEATFCVDGRYLHFGVVGLGYHCDCARGTVLCAVAAGCAVFLREAVVLYPYCVSGADGGLLLACDGINSTCGAYFAAFGTFGAAVSAFKAHFGLHERGEFGGRPQYAIRTGCYTELATGAFF